MLYAVHHTIGSRAQSTVSSHARTTPTCIWSHTHTQVVLRSLEGYSVTEKEDSKPRRKTLPTVKGGYMGLKYLTNSRLFHLQLRDPSVRLQVCGWVCVCCVGSVCVLCRLSVCEGGVSDSLPV